MVIEDKICAVLKKQFRCNCDKTGSPDSVKACCIVVDDVDKHKVDMCIAIKKIIEALDYPDSLPSVFNFTCPKCGSKSNLKGLDIAIHMGVTKEGIRIPVTYVKCKKCGHEEPTWEE